jgi:hypothetical protein
MLEVSIKTNISKWDHTITNFFSGKEFINVVFVI